MSYGYPLASDATRDLLRSGLANLGNRTEQFQNWLLAGQLTQVIAVVDHQPKALSDLLPIVANPGASMSVRFGASAVLERYAGQLPLQSLVPVLGLLTGHGDARVRSDACHLLGLSGSNRAINYLEARRDDPDADVREIVLESLDQLLNNKE